MKDIFPFLNCSSNNCFCFICVYLKSIFFSFCSIISGGREDASSRRGCLQVLPLWSHTKFLFALSSDCVNKETEDEFWVLGSINSMYTCHMAGQTLQLLIYFKFKVMWASQMEMDIQSLCCHCTILGTNTLQACPLVLWLYISCFVIFVRHLKECHKIKYLFLLWIDKDVLDVKLLSPIYLDSFFWGN